MRAVLLGIGAVGTRAARQLASTDGLDRLTIVHHDVDRLTQLADALAVRGRVEVEACPRHALPRAALRDAGVLILATPYRHRLAAEVALELGVHVVSVCDDPAEGGGLLAL